MCTLEKKAGNIINLFSVAAFFAYLGLCFALGARVENDKKEFALIVFGVTIMAATRWLAVASFGKIAPYAVKPREPYPRVQLSHVRAELERLKASGDFIVLFAPDESAYLSFGLKQGAIVVDLAFAVGKFEALEPAFRGAVAKVGATAKPYQKRGMRGIEANLGLNLDGAAPKVQTIMREVFNLKADAEVPVMRES